jgi:hypothetical protein
MSSQAKFIKTIHNVATGEISEIEMTKSEIDEILAQRKIAEIEQKEIQNEIQAKTAARQAIADRLGLTADELKVLLG